MILLLKKDKKLVVQKNIKPVFTPLDIYGKAAPPLGG
ncbi:MAG: hypothetical protein ACI8P3_000720 [Saprospiraceae bacterium]